MKYFIVMFWVVLTTILTTYIFDRKMSVYFKVPLEQFNVYVRRVLLVEVTIAAAILIYHLF